MNRKFISETIRKSMEERKRRQQAQGEKNQKPEPTGLPLAAPPTTPPKGTAKPVTATPASARADRPPAVPVSAAELDRAVRESVLSSFSQWEVKLIPQIEGLVRQVAESVESPLAGDPGSVPGPEGASAEQRGPVDAVPDGDSWEALAHAVRELRREWDQETFENCFAEPVPLTDAETEDLSATVASRPPPAASPAACSPSPPAAGRQPTAVSPELSSRLEELIRLVKSSIAARGSGQVPVVPPELTREIAREVAGRLKANLAGPAPNHPKAEPGEPPATTERIPLDDVASIIDQITGSSPP